MVLEVTTKLYRVYATQDDPKVSIHGENVLFTKRALYGHHEHPAGRMASIRSSVDKASM